MQEELFTTKSAAGYMNCSVPYMRRLKLQGGGPRYVQRGKFVRYRKCDLDAFIEANRHSGLNVENGHAITEEESNAQGNGLNQAARRVRRKK
jgi:hypothetical protein